MLVFLELKHESSQIFGLAHISFSKSLLGSHILHQPIECIENMDPIFFWQALNIDDTLDDGLVEFKVCLAHQEVEGGVIVSLNIFQ